jgi:tRNA C32,U32 (ribose-2'-O)-methylase TrmJ
LLNKVSFYKGNATRVMRKLRRLYYKAEPSQQDVQILLGTIAAINADLEKGKG